VPSDKPEPGAAQTRPGPPREEARRADDALMARIAQGDARAFSELVDSRLDRVMAVARRMLGNETEAEDVAQEAMLRLWRQAENWDGGRAQISTWLYRVTVNLCIDRIRARREETTPEIPDTQVAASQQQTMEEADLRDLMDRTLQALPERQRMALVLFHYEDLSMAAVAEMMEISVEAVESLLARGRRALKQQLEPAWREFLPETEE
jgi:RNA polymerase sigma-70 factor (ECF subfamily)